MREFILFLLDVVVRVLDIMPTLLDPIDRFIG